MPGASSSFCFRRRFTNSKEHPQNPAFQFALLRLNLAFPA